MAAILARAAHNAVRILVRFAQVGRGRGIGMIAQPAHGRFKHAARVGVLERRRGILLLARPFKDVAAIDFLAAQIAGFPADAHHLLGFPVARFEIVVGDRPILNREVLGQLGRSVFLKQVGAQREHIRQEAEGGAAPMLARAARARAGMEGPVLPHRNGAVLQRMPVCDGFLRRILHHAQTDVVVELIHRHRVVWELARTAALEDGHRQGRFRGDFLGRQ